MSSWQRTYVTHEVVSGFGVMRASDVAIRRASRVAMLDHSITMSWLL